MEAYWRSGDKGGAGDVGAIDEVLVYLFVVRVLVQSTRRREAQLELDRTTDCGTISGR
jgi:hypothetical protein